MASGGIVVLENRRGSAQTSGAVPRPSSHRARRCNQGHVRQAGGNSRLKLRRRRCGLGGKLSGVRARRRTRSTAWRIVLRPERHSPCAFGAPLHPPEPFEDGAVQLWVKGGCRPQVDGTAGVSSTTELPYASRQLRLVPQAAISLHARGPDPQALGSVDNDDGLCPKPAYLQAPWIIGKRAFETDYCASLPGTAILAFKPRENPVNVG